MIARGISALALQCLSQRHRGSAVEVASAEDDRQLTSAIAGLDAHAATDAWHGGSGPTEGLVEAMTERVGTACDVEQRPRRWNGAVVTGWAWTGAVESLRRSYRDAQPQRSAGGGG